MNRPDIEELKRRYIDNLETDSAEDSRIQTEQIERLTLRVTTAEQALAECQRYTDKLVAAMPGLPKDLEVLREANGRLVISLAVAQAREMELRESLAELDMRVEAAQGENERLAKLLGPLRCGECGSRVFFSTLLAPAAAEEE